MPRHQYLLSRSSPCKQLAIDLSRNAEILSGSALDLEGMSMRVAACLPSCALLYQMLPTKCLHVHALLLRMHDADYVHSILPHAVAGPKLNVEQSLGAEP